MAFKADTSFLEKISIGLLEHSMLSNTLKRRGIIL